ncbi:hypothetical protein K7432_002274 [Basidiobolus ranarum]|uniref:SMP-LTD domain-containing protein n=1 Tax=Basidiobolus ranarum TaxID=34480 RepID=A0ABR2X206_9FUNG
MNAFCSHLLTFIGGGVLLSPILFLVLVGFLSNWWVKLPNLSNNEPKVEVVASGMEETENSLPHDLDNSQVGWLRMTEEFEVEGDGNNMVRLMQEVNQYVDQTSKRSKSLVYAILKRETLWLYSDENLQACQGVLTVSQFEVTIFPRHLPDNEIYHKELPIHMKKKWENNATEYFFFVNTSSEKEDWFIALLQASRMKRLGIRGDLERSNTLNFDEAAISQLICILHSNKHHEETLWLNGFIGRVFLSIYKTPRIKQLILDKILKKVNKLRMVTFLGNIQVLNVDVGNGAPTISHPKLVELNKTGELKMEFFMNYRGEFSVEIQSQASIEIPIFKPLIFNLGLGITLKELSGRMILHIKPPPTNRFWLGFCEAPSMSFKFAPSACHKQLNFPHLTWIIEKAVVSAIKRALVFPNMDDFPFFDSNGSGGVFAKDEQDSPSTVYGNYPASNRHRSSSVGQDTLNTRSHLSTNAPCFSKGLDDKPPKICINGDTFLSKHQPPKSLFHTRLRCSSLNDLSLGSNSSDAEIQTSPNAGELLTTRNENFYSVITPTRNLSSPEIGPKQSRKRANSRANSNRKNLFGSLFGPNSKSDHNGKIDTCIGSLIH